MMQSLFKAELESLEHSRTLKKEANKAGDNDVLAAFLVPAVEQACKAHKRGKAASPPQTTVRVTLQEPARPKRNRKACSPESVPWMKAQAEVMGAELDDLLGLNATSVTVHQPEFKDFVMKSKAVWKVRVARFRRSDGVDVDAYSSP